MKPIRVLIALLLAAGVTACCPCKRYQKKYGKPLAGTEWQMVQFEGRDRTPDDRYTLIFAKDHSLAGRGECNRLMARYSADEQGHMKITQIASTRMACPDMGRERRFMEMLEQVSDYKMDGPMLMLFCKGEMRAIFQAKGSEANRQQTGDEKEE